VLAAPLIVNDVVTEQEPVRESKQAGAKRKVVAADRGELRKQLEAADTKQESALSSTPEFTAKIYEAKGRVLEAIEALNGIAKNAFALRARRERAPKPA